MKKKLLILKDGDRLYIKDIDLKELKPLLDLVHIEVKTTEQGKYRGQPRHYISIAKGMNFLLSLTSDYVVEIVPKS